MFTPSPNICSYLPIFKFLEITPPGEEQKMQTTNNKGNMNMGVGGPKDGKK